VDECKATPLRLVGAITRTATWGFTFRASIRRPSTMSAISRGPGPPKASLIVSMDPIKVAAITVTTSMGTDFLVHAAMTFPVRVKMRTASNGSLASITEVRSIGGGTEGGTEAITISV